MKVRIKNNSTAIQGISKVGGGRVFIRPRAVRVVDAADPGPLYRYEFLDVEALESEVPDMPASLKAKATPIIPSIDEVLSAKVVSAKPDPFDHDGDGKPGGSRKGKASTASKGARRRRRKAAPK